MIVLSVSLSDKMGFSPRFLPISSISDPKIVLFKLLTNFFFCVVLFPVHFLAEVLFFSKSCFDQLFGCLMISSFSFLFDSNGSQKIELFATSRSAFLFVNYHLAEVLYQALFHFIIYDHPRIDITPS